MISRLIDICAKYRWFVICGYVALGFLASVAVRNISLDAIPDLSDPQVIVYTDWPGRSPSLVEDQITYPLASSLLATPKVTDVRGFSMFGTSFIYVVFEEGTDLYWARSRVLESTAKIRDRLPQDVTPILGPDATGIGWVYQYALVDRSGNHDLSDLRALQDFNLRYALESVPGVAEVASFGGYEKQYQVTLDPEKLRAFDIGVSDIANVVRESNADSGGRLLELSGREYYVRGRGYLEDIGQIEGLSIKTNPDGTPLRIQDVGSVRIGPEIRRGIGELNGEGEAVGGIIVARYGENALDVIDRVKDKIEGLKPGLPKGVEIVETYDRSGLIERSISTLKRALIEEGLVVGFVIIIFLLHLRSAMLPIISLPLTVLLAFIPMWLFKIPATIMSLGGIAIAIGATVDAEIVMVEACHKKLENAPPDLSKKERIRLLGEAAKEVTPAIFFSLIIIAVSFIPVFGLEGQAGRLFKPLAYTKTFVMVAAAITSVTLAPALRDLLLRGRVRSEENHPISRAIRSVYEPFVFVALRNPMTTVMIGLLAVLSAIPVAMRLGSEFMPPLNEGDILYMPTTMPNISIEEAKRQLEYQDRILASFPEVRSVHGKIGRAETATDPAPLSMAETVVQLHPQSEWPKVHEERWWSDKAPRFLSPMLSSIWPEEREQSWDELIDKMNAAMQLPGWTNAFTMPIKTRIDMLSTGVRTPIGVKIFGSDLDEIEAVGQSLEAILRNVEGARSVLYERSLGGTYIDIVPKRDILARWGVNIGSLNEIIESAIGGASVTTTIEGRKRHTVNIRYKEDFRTTPERIREVLVPIPDGSGKAIPLGELADVKVVEGPPMIKNEAGLLVGHVFIDPEPSRDIGGWVEDAKAAVQGAQDRGELELASGMYLSWTGQYELMEKMRERMQILVPLALLAIVVLLYFQFRNMTEVAIVLLSIPFALVGTFWLLYLLDYRLSTAVWVGIIALVGLAAQTGVVMIMYIDHAFYRRLRAGKIRDLNDIIWAHMEGTVLRVRPKLMTVATMLAGLIPLLWATGSGADVMKRIAAPMVGGLISSAFLTLEIIPVVYTYWRYAQLKRAQRTGRPLEEIVGLEHLG